MGRHQRPPVHLPGLLRLLDRPPEPCAAAAVHHRPKGCRRGALTQGAAPAAARPAPTGPRSSTAPVRRARRRFRASSCAGSFPTGSWAASPRPRRPERGDRADLPAYRRDQLLTEVFVPDDLTLMSRALAATASLKDAEQGAGLWPASGSRRGRETHSCMAQGRPGSHATNLSDHRRRGQHRSSAVLRPQIEPLSLVITTRYAPYPTPCRKVTVRTTVRGGHRTATVPLYRLKCQACPEPPPTRASALRGSITTPRHVGPPVPRPARDRLCSRVACAR
ncbi:hypothetical protein CFP59_00077 [Streptomyces malaysiensis subsp. malaysiensis]|nr:hypothetical protein CFP59_00077 [Streptomyces sp. M56]